MVLGTCAGWFAQHSCYRSLLVNKVGVHVKTDLALQLTRKHRGAGRLAAQSDDIADHRAFSKACKGGNKANR